MYQSNLSKSRKSNNWYNDLVIDLGAWPNLTQIKKGFPLPINKVAAMEGRIKLLFSSTKLFVDFQYVFSYWKLVSSIHPRTVRTYYEQRKPLRRLFPARNVVNLRVHHSPSTVLSVYNPGKRITNRNGFWPEFPWTVRVFFENVR